MVARDLHRGYQVAPGLGPGLRHLLQAGRVGLHQVVGQQDGKGLVAHEVARAPDGVPQAQRLLLADVGDLPRLQQHVLGDRQHVLLAALGQGLLQLV